MMSLASIQKAPSGSDDDSDQNASLQLKLHRKVNVEMFMRLKRAFQIHNNWLTKQEFRKILYSICGLVLEDEDYEVLYMKIDSERYFLGVV